ncbi:MAG: cytochrome P450, partial [Methylosarcina sp.]
KRFYLLSHPDLAEQALVEQPDVFVKMYDPAKPKGLQLVLGQGLVTSTGSLWQQQRRLLQPVFQRRGIDAMRPQMAAAGEQWVRRWQKHSPGAEVDIANEMMRLTLESADPHDVQHQRPQRGRCDRSGSGYLSALCRSNDDESAHSAVVGADFRQSIL